MTRNVEQLIAPWIRELVPYHVEEPSGLIKLDAMENPYTFTSELRTQWLEVIGRTAINRYPDPGAGELKERIRVNSGLPDSGAVALGNGSDELIHLLYTAFNCPGAAVVCPEPTFTVYRLAAQAMGVDYHGVPLRTDDFSLDLPAMCDAIEAYRPSLVFLASPNNPTGNAFAFSAIERICDISTGLVVVDEAYWRFAGESLIRETERLENLLIMQTLSKVGLAGIRIGMLFGHPDWLGPVEKVRMPYNINSLSQVTALFALEHGELLQQQIDKICEDRKTLWQALSAIDGVRVWPSQTNFLLFKTPMPAATVFESLRHQGILIKNVDGMHPLLRDCLRVTVGLPRENERFISALRKCG